MLHAPGHHLDQVVAWMPEMRLLLAFDAVEEPLPIIEAANCVPHMFSTLEQLIALQPLRVLCSHGKTTSPEQITKNLAYIREIESRSKSVLQEQRQGETELVHASELINYPFDEVVGGTTGTIDRTFYTWAHENNCQAILKWLISQS